MSVLKTQDRLLEAEAERRELKQKLKECEERVALALLRHKEQIQRSLSSKDTRERGMAENVRAWFEVEPLADLPTQVYRSAQ